MQIMHTRLTQLVSVVKPDTRALSEAAQVRTGDELLRNINRILREENVLLKESWENQFLVNKVRGHSNLVELSLNSYICDVYFLRNELLNELISCFSFLKKEEHFLVRFLWMSPNWYLINDDVVQCHQDNSSINMWISNSCWSIT